MANELATIFNGLTVESPDTTSEAIAMVTTVGKFLPYVTLMGGSTLPVKRGQFPIGHFALHQGKTLVDLGVEFPALVVAWRPKAMIYKPQTLAYYDTKSKAFQDIQATADVKDSGKGYGPDFLLWLPANGLFATYFLGNKTGRNEAPNLLGPLRKNGPFYCIQASDLIETSKNSWHGPVTKSCGLSFDPPDMAETKRVLENFLHPPVEQVEVADKDDEDSDRK